MAGTAIAHRYALALLEIGVARKNCDQLGRELDRLLGVFNSAPELRELLRNPKFTVATRKAVLGDVARRLMVNDLTRNFVLLLCDRQRIVYLPQIVEAFHALADVESGRVRASVTVAAALNEAELARLRAVLQKLTGRQVVVEQKEDATLIGGVITRIDGRVYDGSVRAQLDALRSKLLHTQS